MRNYFPKLYGNDAVKTRLGEAITNESLPHAFLLIGPDGSGKKTLTAEIAAALNCENKSDLNVSLPCHRCNTCRRIAEGNFTDITRLRRGTDKATIGVEDVRTFREDMFLSATESDFKIYVIEDAERLTPNAQNALLTVLEEPPKNVIILLLCESADKILTTIKSRAQSIFMSRFSPDKLKEYVCGVSERARSLEKISRESLEGILMSSDGRIGRALSLLSEKEAESNKEDREVTESIVYALKQGTPYSELYKALSRLPQSRADFSDALESVMTAIRDLTLLKQDSTLPLLFFTSRDKAMELAKTMKTKRLISVYDIFKDALEDVSKNVGVNAVSSNLGAKIKLI